MGQGLGREHVLLILQENVSDEVCDQTAQLMKLTGDS